MSPANRFARTDIAGAFPGFSNTAAAGGHFIIDWSTLTTGAHTIGWLITDDCNRADGVGSRFFNVTTGTALRAAETAIAEPPSLFVASRTSETESEEPITVAHGARFIDMRPVLRAAAARTVLHGPRDWNHFNDAGYRVLGETLAQTIDDAASTGCVDWN